MHQQQPELTRRVPASGHLLVATSLSGDGEGDRARVFVPRIVVEVGDEQRALLCTGVQSVRGRPRVCSAVTSCELSTRPAGAMMVSRLHALTIALVGDRRLTWRYVSDGMLVDREGVGGYLEDDA